MSIEIGTSGWSYREFYPEFYPKGLPAAQMLPFYTRHLSSVEINNSFYRLPELRTFENWNRLTPERFIFSVKASRYISHIKRLRECEAELAVFLERLKPLGRKLGPVLFQLPPRWKLDLDRFKEFTRLLPPGYRYVFEFRDPSWLVDPVYRILEERNLAFCIYDLEGFLSPLRVTADFAYVRLHGPKLKYAGEYSAQSMSAWHRRLLQWEEEGKDSYIYFDNTADGAAIRNALTMEKKIRALPGRDKRPEQAA